MSQRWLLLFLILAILAPAQIPSRIVRLDNTEPEAARLSRYYSLENRDPSWSTRLAILLNAIQKDPTADFLSSPEMYSDIPTASRDQVKQAWVAQVQQHPADPRVLRNAAFALENRPPPPPPLPFPSLAPTPNQIRVGGSVQAANILNKVQPEYPANARQAGIQGLFALMPPSVGTAALKLSPLSPGIRCWYRLRSKPHNSGPTSQPC